MDVRSQPVTYRRCIPVRIIRVLRVPAIEDVFGDCCMDVLFLFSRRPLVRGEGRSRPRLIPIVVQYIPVSWTSYQPRNQLLDTGFTPDDIWKFWSQRLGGRSRWSGRLLGFAFAFATCGPSWGVWSRSGFTRRLGQCPIPLLLHFRAGAGYCEGLSKSREACRATRALSVGRHVFKTPTRSYPHFTLSSAKSTPYHSHPEIEVNTTIGRKKLSVGMDRASGWRANHDRDASESLYASFLSFIVGRRSLRPRRNGTPAAFGRASQKHRTTGRPIS
jgi:hypothetical protein